MPPPPLPTPHRQPSPLLFEPIVDGPTTFTSPPPSAGPSLYSFSSASLTDASTASKFEFDRLQIKFRASQEQLVREREFRQLERVHHDAEIALLEGELAARSAELTRLRQFSGSRQGSSGGGRQ